MHLSAYTTNIHHCAVLELAFPAMANHAGSPKTNKSPPVDLPASPESLATLALVDCGGNTLSLSLAFLCYGWFRAGDLVSSLFVHDMEHGAKSAFITSWGDNSCELLVRTAKCLHIFVA